MTRFPYKALPDDDPRVYDAVRYRLDGGSDEWVARKLNVNQVWVQHAWTLWRNSLDQTPYRALSDAEIMTQSATFIPALLKATEQARRVSATKRKPPKSVSTMRNKLSELFSIRTYS